MSTSSATGAETLGKQSGTDSQIPVLEAPTTTTLSTKPIPSFYAYTTQTLFNQIKAYPVSFDGRHRMLDCILFPDSLKQMISHFRILNLRNAPAATNSAREGHSQHFGHFQDPDCTYRSNHSGCYQGKRWQDKAILVVAPKSDR